MTTFPHFSLPSCEETSNLYNIAEYFIFLPVILNASKRFYFQELADLFSLSNKAHILSNVWSCCSSTDLFELCLLN